MSELAAAGRHALVIGYGSIGQRHAEVLRELGCNVAILSRRQLDAPQVFGELSQALREHAPDYVVLANQTAQHAASLAALAATGYSGALLVEKPVFGAPTVLPAHSFGQVGVGYNLRFHPVIARLATLLASARIFTCVACVGQYLPDWRPGTDYRAAYSSSAQQGGGALRDLSHELDYLCWLLGGWRSVAALGGQVSDLEISSDDAFALLLTTTRCPVVSVHLNYLERQARRSIVFNTDSGTIEADLIAGTLSINGAIERYSTERNATYRAMHTALLAGRKDTVASLGEGLATVALIDSAERAAQTQQWIHQ